MEEKAAGEGSGSARPGGEDATRAGSYALYAIAFTVHVGTGIVAPILPEIMGEFALSASQIGMMVTVYALARLAVDLPLGLFLDRLDRVKLLIVGSLLIVAGATAAGLAGNYPLLLAARMTMGMGSALATVTILFSLSKSAKAHSRGKTIGIFQAALMAGTTVSPAIGGVVASVAGWRAAFFFCAFTGAAAVLLVVAAVKGGKLALPTTARRQKGAEGPAPAEGKPRRIPWNLVAINFTTLVFFFSVNGFRNTVVPVYGGKALGVGTATLGLLLGGSAMIRFMITLGSGIGSDRYGRKVILIPGILVLVTGTLSFLLAGDLPGFALALLILSLGGFGNSLPTTMVVDAVPAGRVGFAVSVNRFMADTGVVLGPVTLGWILDVAGFPTVIAVVACTLLSTIPGVMLTVHETRRVKRPAPAEAR